MSEEEMMEIAGRIGTAFGIDSIEATSSHEAGLFFMGWLINPTPELEKVEMQSGVLRSNGELDLVELGTSFANTFVERKPNDINGWMVQYSNQQLNAVMARGLYRLGIEDEYVFTQLDHPLTAHERIELHLSFPRELWPQKWLDEEVGECSPLDN